MKLIILLIIGVLFASSEAGRYNIEPSINVEGRYKRSISTDFLIDVTGISDIKITSEYSADEGLKAICRATGENLSYAWFTKIGDLLSNEVAAGNVLIINQVTKENDREFCCKVFNSAETAEKCKRLGPLIISSDPLERTVDSSAEMFCEVFGIDDHFDIKWERSEGLPTAAIVNDGVLKIPKLVKEDTGDYICVGSLHGKTAFYQKIPLEVVTPPEIVELRSTGLDGEYDNNVTIQCITQPDETITYAWKTHRGGRTDLRENEKIEGNLLSIYDFREDNQGTFCCVAANTLLSTEKCLTIEPPILEMHHKVRLGSSLNLECHESVGHLNMKIDWERENGHQLAPNTVKLLNGSLAMRNITIENGGRYKCTATKGVLSASVTTVIEVVMMPVIPIIPEINESITAKLGEKVNLTCNTDGHPQPTVLWRKFSPGTELHPISEIITKKSAVYEIKSLSENDAGLYLCSAKNSTGSSDRTVQVIIQWPVLEVHPTVSHTVIAGKSVTLECRESAGYLDMKFTWSRDDNSSFPSNVHQSDNGSLTITDIAINQEGRYKCSASNGLASASVITEIEVRTLPVIKIAEITDGNITKKLGDTVKLTCEAEGHSEPTVQWQKFSHESNSYDIVKPATPRSAVHEITSLSTSEAGLYLCLAVNPAGSSNKTVRVVIKQPVLAVYPKDPHVVIAGSSMTLECRESVGYSDMKFTWSREDNSSLAANVHQSNDGSLTITDIAINQTGRYMCFATNEKASASVTRDIALDSSISEVKITHKTTKTEHRMNCSAIGEELSYKWSADSAFDSAYEILNGDLILGSWQRPQQDRIYCCEVSNRARTLRKCLRVDGSILHSDHPSGSVGESVELECTPYRSEQKIFHIEWKRADGLPLPKNAIMGNYTLKFPELTKTDAATYACVGNYKMFGRLQTFDIRIPLTVENCYNSSTSNGLVSASITTEIEVRTLPVIRNPGITDGDITKKLGETVKLTCEAEGHPEPIVQWQKFSNESNSYQIVKRAAPRSAVHDITLLTNETGLYLCSATNPAGSSNKTVRVAIKQPVLEVYPKDAHVVILGGSIMLECQEFAGYSDMKFTWSRDDNSSFPSNVHQSDNGSLTITDIAISQEGRYKCSASNGLASASVTTVIEVRTLPVIKIAEITDGNITKKLGDTVKLTCEAEGHSEPTVQWQKFSHESNSYDIVKPATPRSAVHEITSLSTSEAGLYLCLAVNPAGSSNKTVRVVIKQPVLAVYPKDPHVVIAGSSMTLECRESVGYSDMKFTWSREDNSSLAANVHQSNDGSLTITDIAINQTGRYMCFATNEKASASVTRDIALDSSISEVKITHKTTKTEHRMNCSAIGEELSYKWSADSAFDSAYEILNGDLILGSWQRPQQDRIYCCEVSNRARTLRKCLRVDGSILHSDHPSGSVGESVELECTPYRSEQKIFHIEWKRADGLPLPKNAIMGNYTLKFPELAKTDAATYACVGNYKMFGRLQTFDIRIPLTVENCYNCSTSNGLVSASITTEIEVRTLPVIRNPGITDGDITKKLGETVKLTCEAEGHPEPIVQWQKFSNESNSYQIVNRAAPRSAVHDITLLTSETGLYLCSATNPAGSSNKTVRVAIKQPVLEVYPKDAHVVILGGSIMLECQEFAGYSDMKFAWSRDDNSSFPSNVHQSDNGSLTITDIAINQEGRYKCSASNGLASASVTTEIEVRTLPVIKIAEITDGNITKKLGDTVKLTCEAESHSEPTVQWQKFSHESNSYDIVKPATPRSAVHEIMSLSTSEAGLYLCLAVNPAGSSNKTVRVVIKQPVLEVYPKDPHVVIAGSSISLECRESVGYSDMKFTWSREDNSSFAANVHQSDDGSLTITDIAINQAGRYMCFATNGKASASVTADIALASSISEVKIAHKTTKTGHRMNCSAIGKELSYKWTADSAFDSAYEILNGDLTIGSWQRPQQDRIYCCEVSNTARTLKKCLRVDGSILHSDHPSGLVGESVELECTPYRLEQKKFHIEWKRADGLPLPKNAIMGDSTLKFPELAKTDAATYACVGNYKTFGRLKKFDIRIPLTVNTL